MWKRHIEDWVLDRGIPAERTGIIEKILIRDGWDPDLYQHKMRDQLYLWLDTWHHLAQKKMPRPATRLRKNPDESLRQLEREAAGGDPIDIVKLFKFRERTDGEAEILNHEFQWRLDLLQSGVVEGSRVTVRNIALHLLHFWGPAKFPLVNQHSFGQLLRDIFPFPKFYFTIVPNFTDRIYGHGLHDSSIDILPKFTYTDRDQAAIPVIDSFFGPPYGKGIHVLSVQDGDQITTSIDTRPVEKGFEYDEFLSSKEKTQMWAQWARNVVPDRDKIRVPRDIVYRWLVLLANGEL